MRGESEGERGREREEWSLLRCFTRASASFKISAPNRSSCSRNSSRIDGTCAGLDDDDSREASNIDNDDELGVSIVASLPSSIPFSSCLQPSDIEPTDPQLETVDFGSVWRRGSRVEAMVGFRTSV
jgi:hypothetical protein